MSRFETQLLTQVIDTGDIRSALRAVTSDHFFRPEARSVWNYLREFYTEHGATPSRDLVAATVPAFVFESAMDPVPALVQQVHEFYSYNLLNATMEQVAEIAKSDTMEAVRHLADRAMQLRALSSGRMTASVDLTLAVQEEVDAYYRRKNLKGLLGLAWPWPRLNRATFGIQPGQLIVFYARPKQGKCLRFDAEVLGRNGAPVQIGKAPDVMDVPSHTASTGKIRWAKAELVYSGVKDCVEVATASGNKLNSGAEHLYMVPGGEYKRACDLKPGDAVAIARRLEWEPEDSLTDADAHYLGLLIGDGGLTAHVTFTKQDASVVEAVRRHTERWGGELRPTSEAITWNVCGRESGHNPIMDWLRRLGAWGSKSRDKQMPARVYTSTPSAVAAFVAGLIDTDGYVGGKGVSYSSASEGLARGVKHLLRRLGIQARLGECTTNFGTKAYNVTVYSSEQHRLLWAVLGPHMCCTHKRAALEVFAAREGTEKRNIDGIPYSAGLLSTILEEKGSKEWPQMGTSALSRDKLFRRSGWISRGLLRKLAEAWNSQVLWDVLAEDICWERVVSVTPTGKHPCYDFCIRDGLDPNYVAGDFIVHNTWLLLYTAAHLHYYSKQRIVIFTREMTVEELRRRFCALWAGIDYDQYLRGCLTAADEYRWLEAMEAFAESPPVIIESVAESGAEAADAMIMRAQELEADVLAVDGIYFYGNREWECIAQFTSRLKYHLLNTYKIPCLGTTQGTRRKGAASTETMEDIGYGDSVGQDADVLIKCILIKEDQRVYLSLPGIREGKDCEFQIWMKPAYDFKQSFAEDGHEDEVRTGTTVSDDAELINT